METEIEDLLNNIPNLKDENAKTDFQLKLINDNGSIGWNSLHYSVF